jgi:hypothetical protein
VIVKLEILRALVPVLLSVAVSVALVVPTGWFPKERLPGETLPVGSEGATPVPLRPTFLRPPQPLVEMLRVALRDPVVLGVKVKLIVQLASGASELPQLLACPNLLAYVPLISRLLMDRFALPVFCRVTFCGALVVLTGTDPNETLTSDTAATPWLCPAENAIVLEAETTASAVMAARIPALRRA